MKRSNIVFCSISIILLMISTVTAIPQAQSNTILNIIEENEQNRNLLEIDYNKYIKNDSFNNFIKFNISKFIDLLVRLIDFILRISGLIASIISTISLIYSIISQLNYYISIIIQILEWIDSFLNPDII